MKIPNVVSDVLSTPPWSACWYYWVIHAQAMSPYFMRLKQRHIAISVLKDRSTHASPWTSGDFRIWEKTPSTILLRTSICMQKLRHPWICVSADWIVWALQWVDDSYILVGRRKVMYFVQVHIAILESWTKNWSSSSVSVTSWRCERAIGWTSTGLSWMGGGGFDEYKTRLNKTQARKGRKTEVRLTTPLFAQSGIVRVLNFEVCLTIGQCKYLYSKASDLSH